MALYRKYRPATFADVVGQEHVTDPLCTALDTGRISHAYLFSGPRGCGKTSSARILARSLNCAQGPTSTPCGTCGSCVSLAPGGGGNLDVIELDAASHGGVDDTRELRDRAFYAPAESRYRVFIVDEAHMVTTAGFNALLKIVEEPPAHLIFVFATTEPEKVLPTIRSRTHHYPFRLLPPATMRGLLGDICEQERVPVEETVYPLVIRAGGGSPRDSLSVLDQLLAGAGNEGVTYSRAVALLGVTDVALIDDAVDALAENDGAALFGTVDRVMEAGHDPRRFAVDLLERLRDLILVQAVPDAFERGLVAAPGDLVDRMRDQAGRVGPATLTRCAELLHAGLGEMRGATAPRLLLEVVCSRMVLPAADGSAAATLQRLEQLERRVAAGVVAAPGAGGASETGPAAASAPARPPADPSRRRGAEALAAARGSRTARTPDRGAGESAAADAAPGQVPPAAAQQAGPPPHPPAASGPGDRVGPPEQVGPRHRPETAAEQRIAPETSSTAAGTAGSRDEAAPASREFARPGDAGPGRAGESSAARAAESEPVPGDESAAMRSGSETARADDPTPASDAVPARGPVAGHEPDSASEHRVGASFEGGADAPSRRGPESGAESTAAPATGFETARGTAAAGPERAATSGPEPAGAPEPDAASGPEPAAEPGPDPAAATGGPDLLAAVEAAWPEIKVKVREFGPTIGAMLTSGASVAGVEDGEILFAHHAALVQRLSQPQSLSAVRSAVAAVLGHEHPVRWVVAGQHQTSRGPGGRERGGRRQARDSDSGDSDSSGRRAPVRRSTAGRATDDASSGPDAGVSATPAAESSATGSATSAGASDTRGEDPGRTPVRRGSGGPPRFSRPSQAKSGVPSGPVDPYGDVPPPDFPDLPDDPGGGEYGHSAAAVPASTPEEEREMLAESARPVAPGDRRDPDEVALELLASELGATRLNG
ncbi:DNA polymerase III subunit gamma and tau [Nocardia sp. NPDC024068]|uniref:DNA polymerase III subunit gamma and tau n=1 Tax=Nocardia sp. NPDC024068 TaxID=3157197 RepID=UPI0033EC8F6C